MCERVYLIDRNEKEPKQPTLHPPGTKDEAARCL